MRGNVESMILYSKLLLHGSKSFPSDVKQSIYWLKKASKSSPEASFLLGKMYRKGKYLTCDIRQSYFYFRLASIFKCRCGKFKDEYHLNKITNVYVCYPYAAIGEIERFCLSDKEKKKVEEDFNNWCLSNLRY